MAETKNVSRRDFIIGGGGVVAGAVVGGVVGTGAFPRQIVKEVPVEKIVEKTVTVEKVVPRTFAAAASYLVVDSKKCAGCLTCMFTCSMVHEKSASLSASRIQITQNSLRPFPIDLNMEQCRQCVDPLCVENCPTGACHVDAANGNVRVIDQAKCIGCQTCLKMCPHPPHRTAWDTASKKAVKCDLCATAAYFNKPDSSKPQQACVLACPMGALAVVKQVPDQTDDRGYDVNLRKA